jgi:antitoxin component YwqK of YwqJK toxin-antitoxin module
MAEKRVVTAEIRYASGAVQFRYDHYLSADGQRWVRHGPFQEFYEDGTLACEGQYEDGLEQGRWRDYHENGQLAADGYFVDGAEDGVWQFWTAKGKEEETIVYRDGVEIGP